jgi:hypothetical protein
MPGCEIFQAVSRRLFTAEAQVRSQAIDMGYVADKMASSLFPPIPIPQMFHIHTVISHGIGRSTDTYNPNQIQQICQVDVYNNCGIFQN